MKILITGNCGFIGQNFVKLYREEVELVGIDKMGYAANPHAAAHIKTFKEDIANENIYTIFEKINDQYGPFDGIINFAAESHVDNSIDCPTPFIYSNIIGTFNMLEIAKRHNIRRFVQVGTDEVYGDLQPGEAPFSNLYEMKPSSPYSASKAAADMLALSYFRTFNLNVVITRSCNNYGPHQHHEKFIPVIINKALQNEPIPVYGTGMNMREWIHVEDNCKGIMKTFLKGSPGAIYNLGSGTEKTNLDLVKAILSLMEKPQTLIELVEDRKGHDFRYFLDSHKANTELGWHPVINLETGLRETIEHYAAQLR